MSSLKKLAIRGAIWTIISYGASQVLRFGSNLILTRLLVPELFGLMALVTTFIVGLNLFSDIGAGPSIIQNKRGDDPDFLNTAWTLQVMRGFALWLCCLAIAWPISQFYNDPRLRWLIPLVGAGTIISGFSSTAVFSLNRHMDIGKLTIFQFTAQALSIVVTVVWAFFSPTIWALVGGQLSSSLIRMVWSHFLIPGKRNRFAWDKDALQDLFTFGRWIFISTAMTFLAGQADRLILGKLLSFQMLGVYTVAFTLSDMPRQIVGAINSKVLFAATSKLVSLPRETFRAKILGKRKLIIAVLALALAVLITVGDLLIEALYDDRYTEAGWMLPILGLGLWPRLLSQTIDPSLLALGKPYYVATGNFLKFLFMIIGLPLGFYLGQVPGAIIVIALNDFPYYAAVTYGLWREGMNCSWQDLQATGLFLASLALLLFGRHLLGFGIPFQIAL
ncbi:oligosaccharide flippase family protein [Microcoleus sp. FACHB-672]|uniref:oligosaccharide flippase family protein n=1 Tax=Microcoleus sp. FACHB-672 TaxID=2692825 RepID=UPI001683FDDB|nr:oligosaccharide flippase family protein [Microcoleus sp. FACHB-672]MBD2043735.1 oligosaccharide flippase family protein [Microcoleus sp. FACHB-672]